MLPCQSGGFGRLPFILVNEMAMLGEPAWQGSWSLKLVRKTPSGASCWATFSETLASLHNSQEKCSLFSPATNREAPHAKAPSARLDASLVPCKHSQINERMDKQINGGPTW